MRPPLVSTQGYGSPPWYRARHQPDARGLPRPRISYRYDEYTRLGLAEAQQLHEQVFAALGVTEQHHAEDVKGSSHLIGTCRMGTDPRTSVVDADLRAHDHPNLFLVGSAVFPTGGVSNPTLTITALALRAAGTIRQDLTPMR